MANGKCDNCMSMSFVLQFYTGETHIGQWCITCRSAVNTYLEKIGAAVIVTHEDLQGKVLIPKV
jgi:hypothetical protein